MKKFIISVLCVSIFFIGLGGLAEKAGAKFKSDAKALELVRLARIAIGGDANINNVRSMTISGTTAQTFNNGGTAQAKQGNVEINFEFPGKFSKMVRIGGPGSEAANAGFNTQPDVFVVKQETQTAELTDSGDGKKIVIIKKGDGTVLTEDVKPVEGERRIIFKNEDGTIREITPDDKNTVIFEKKSGDENAALRTESGKKIVIETNAKVFGAGEIRSAVSRNELLRTTLALLLTAPEGTDVGYTFAGESSVDGTAANIIDVESNGSKFKLFLDKTTNLPLMVSYSGMPLRIKLDKAVSTEDETQKDVRVFVNKNVPSATIEHQVKFSDFRSVNGLLLPYKWTETVGGNAGETVDITSYEINPANIADKFQNEKILIRTQKP